MLAWSKGRKKLIRGSTDGSRQKKEVKLMMDDADGRTLLKPIGKHPFMSRHESKRRNPRGETDHVEGKSEIRKSS